MTRAHLDKRPKDVAGMFDAVSRRYDVTNEVMAMGQLRRWRNLVRDAVEPRPGEVILDIAAGTGASSVPLVKAGARVLAADFSLGMLREGRRRRPGLQFVAADATGLPFGSESFDAVTISYGLRNVADVAAALTEFARVTRPGGCLVVAEFSQPTHASFRTLYHRHVLGLLPRIADLFSSDPESYRYLVESIRDWPEQSDLARTIRDAGWQDVEWRNLSGGIVALHRAWRPS